VRFSSSFEVREQTLLTPKRVAQTTGFLEWNTQPSLFKHYPDFCYRVSYRELTVLPWLKHLRSITKARRIAEKPYYQLNVPSAGNLHPLEIYLQIRNVPGLLEGIYHLDVLHEELVLIHDIEREGVEPCVGMQKRFGGVIIMISLVPFRSSWKYGLRAWRYVYLDLGHQIAALYASVRHSGAELTKMSQIDTEGLNRVLGMGEDEFVSAVFAIGEMGKAEAKPLSMPLMKVSPCDYLHTHEQLSARLAKEPLYTKRGRDKTREGFEKISLSRRSAREFHPGGADAERLSVLMAIPAAPSLEIVSVVLQAQGMQCGIYRKGSCAEEGDFSAQIVHLLLEQRFISDAALVVLIFAERFDAHVHIEAGIYAHKLYLASESLGLGCSGIGAFYDDEALRFSQQPLLYAAAIGGKKDE
jgi:SagB-type dehydrogenase family enzyme